MASDVLLQDDLADPHLSCCLHLTSSGRRCPGVVVLVLRLTMTTFYDIVGMIGL